MGRPIECANMILTGNNPREIADDLGITIGSVMNYLYTSIGSGRLNRSDVLLSIDKVIREDFEEIIKQAEISYSEVQVDTRKETHDEKVIELPDIKIREHSWNDIYHKIKYLPNCNDIDMELFKIYYYLRKPEEWIGDLYLCLRGIEITLHQLIWLLLTVNYGSNENDWWRRIPLSIRQECQKRREEDKTPEDPYYYLNLIDIKKIFEKEWKILSQNLTTTLNNKKLFCKHLVELNHIRNKVMHPIKATPTIEDFCFVRDLYYEINRGLDEPSAKKND